MNMKKVKHAIQDDYDDSYSWCYGCGRLNEDGLHLRTGWDEDNEGNTITIYEPRKEHKAIPGFIYGGLLASLIDCHGTGSASIFLHRKNGYEPGDGKDAPRFVTASLQVNFLQPTPEGVPLKAIGVVEEIHPKKFRVMTEVYADGKVVVTGVVTAVVMPDTFIENRK